LPRHLDKEIAMPSTHLLIERLLYWVPRILCILFAAFISLFALDVFGEGYGFWHSVLSLMVHLIPTYIVVVALIVAWRFEVVGGALLILLAGWYVIETWDRFPHGTALVIAGPLLVAGGLFLCDSVYRARHRSTT
jgi:hypothetical protein